MGGKIIDDVVASFSFPPFEINLLFSRVKVLDVELLQSPIFCSLTIQMYPEPMMRHGNTSLGVKVAMDRKTSEDFIQELIRLRREIEEDKMTRINAAAA